MGDLAVVMDSEVAPLDMVAYLWPPEEVRGRMYGLGLTNASTIIV